jgi:hypothetical protein
MYNSPKKMQYYVWIFMMYSLYVTLFALAVQHKMSQNIWRRNGRLCVASRFALVGIFGRRQELKPCVWLESRESGAEPTHVLGTAPTPLKFGSYF